MRFSLPQYLTRINALSCLSAPPTLETLTTVMASHMCSISFENMDVVQNKAISITPEAVFDKLVAQGRGGYCFETNTLLQCALLELGFAVSPVLCRVRWGKAPTQETGFTHLILKATDADGKTFLADVGFSGTNSIAPVSLDVGNTPQHLPEGTFRVQQEEKAADYSDYSYLEVQDRPSSSSSGDSGTGWKELYCWHNVPCLLPDIEMANWFSCTYEKARFTTQFFVSRIVDNERLYILNDRFVRRNMAGEVVAEEEIHNKERLLHLVSGVFGSALPEDTTLLDKYLRHYSII